MTHLQPIVLRADYSSPPARWPLVARIPYGRGRGQLGFIPESLQHSPQPMVPFAFGVASDGSFWILDEVKRRVAHYSSSGGFLGDITGFRFDRFHPHPRDLVVTGDRPVVLEQGLGLEAIGDVPAGGGGFDRTPITDRSRKPVRVDRLVQTTGPVVAYVSGRPLTSHGALPASPRGIFRIDLPGSGGIHRLPGMPLGDGSFISLASGEPQPFEVTYANGSNTSTREVTIDVIGAGRRLSASVGPLTEAATEHSIAAYVSLAPSKATTAARFGNGRWFLELSDDSTPLRWERLPTPTFDDETQVRHLAAGPDGSIYLMQVDGTGISIYRQ